MRKIKCDDEVIVLVGKNRGKRGTVRKVLEGGKLLVAGVNVVKKHTKPDPRRDIPGGIVEKERPIQASNVAILNPETNRADRVGFKRDGDDKVRIFKSTGMKID